MAAKKSVLITGCSEGGLGDALARAFHQKGYRVFATARNPKKMAHFENLGIETVVLDVLSKESIKSAVEEVSKLADGKLDILINNSGGGYMLPIMDVDTSKARDLFDLNVLSNVSVIQAFFPLLEKAAPGSIIANNTSVAGSFGLPFNSIYNATKSAMSTITNDLRVELSPFGIKVVDLKTGSVKTNFFQNQSQNHSTAEEMKLPPDSIYSPGREKFERHINGEFVMDGAIDADTWAKQVVGDLTGWSGPPNRIYRGTYAWMAWFVRAFLPHWVTDGPGKSMIGLDEFAKTLKQQKKQS